MTIGIGVDLHNTQFATHARIGETVKGQYATEVTGCQAFQSQVRAWQTTKMTKVKIGVESTGIRGTSRTALSEKGSK